MDIEKMLERIEDAKRELTKRCPMHGKPPMKRCSFLKANPMDEINILKINGDGGECFQCGKQAKYIAGDYDVCGSDECFEFAFEKAEEDLAEMNRTRHAIMAQARYEAALNK